MRKVIALVLFLVLLLPCTAFASKGVIVFYNDLRSKIIIQTPNGYSCGEVYSVHTFVEPGQYVVGDLDSFGTKQIYNLALDESMNVWIDDCWLTRAQAMDWLARQ